MRWKKSRASGCSGVKKLAVKLGAAWVLRLRGQWAAMAGQTGSGRLVCKLASGRGRRRRNSGVAEGARRTCIVHVSQFAVHPNSHPTQPWRGAATASLSPAQAHTHRSLDGDTPNIAHKLHANSIAHWPAAAWLRCLVCGTVRMTWVVCCLHPASRV